MLQRSGTTNTECNNGMVNCSPSFPQQAPLCQSGGPALPPCQSGGPALHPSNETQQAPFQREHGAGVMVHWKPAFPQQLLQSPKKGLALHSEDEERCPLTPPPPRERLSYTRHQLELLNGIYLEVKYPNSTQKQLIAKRVGITREQVKIWFQNRRRKDVVVKIGRSKSVSKDDSNLPHSGMTTPTWQGNSESCNETKEVLKEDTSSCGVAGHLLLTQSQGADHSQGADNSKTDDPDSIQEQCNGRTNDASSCVGSNNVQGTGAASRTLPPTELSSSNLVSPTILRGMIAELNKFDNEYLKLKKSRKKKNKSKLTRQAPPTPSTVGLAPCRSERLFQNYDMVAPPNKVTPTAFLNTSVNKFKHAVGTSAFQSLRESRLLTTSNDNQLWDGFAGHPSTSGIMDAAEFLQQRSSSEIVHPPFRTSLSFPQPLHQSQYNSFLSGRDAVSLPPPPTSQAAGCDNLPVLSDLLANYKNHQSSANAIAAAAAVAAAQRQQEHSFLSSVSSSQIHPTRNMSSVYFNLPVGNNTSVNGGDTDNTLVNDFALSRPGSLSIFHHCQSSSMAMNRVFPYPLVAEPPTVLSGGRQSETLLHHSQWPHAGSSLNPQPSLKGPIENHSNPSSAPVSLSEEHYRPLVISSASNPYFSHSTSTYPLPSSGVPSQSPLWSI